ncbi:hypothetical protein P1P75_00915 [Streptomyces sp. ID05-39B]|uniref:DUF7187 family protein n=1 Tax=Streptomyces sp. ID05-39B TaxID=3028664 RepID=UPI0029A3F4E5|nr:hypothetical protein [Streptomyces sp. ID05-39B]MDX3525049.1 hypothetical protein [Streptomyces sp. ID05-39B]
MNGDEEQFISPEDREGGEVAASPELVDHFAGVSRAASIVGDLREALRKEGFTRKETFELVKTYWAAEMGVFD